MRIVFFLLGMMSFIIAGMLHVPLVGVLGFVLAVVALLLAGPQAAAHRPDRIIQRDDYDARLLVAPERAPASDAVAAPLSRASGRMTRHHVHHAWRARSAHASNSRQRRTTSKEM